MRGGRQAHPTIDWRHGGWVAPTKKQAKRAGVPALTPRSTCIDLRKFSLPLSPHACLFPTPTPPSPSLSQRHLTSTQPSTSDLTHPRRSEPQTNATPRVSRPPSALPRDLPPSHLTSPRQPRTVSSAPCHPNFPPSPAPSPPPTPLHALYFRSPSARRVNWKVGKEGAGLGPPGAACCWGSRDSPHCCGAAPDWLAGRGLCEMSQISFLAGPASGSARHISHSG